MTSHYKPTQYQQVKLYEQDISDWTPEELTRLMANDKGNNLRIKRDWLGNVKLEYVVEVGVN